jgi:hypothetical protein
MMLDPTRRCWQRARYKLQASERPQTATSPHHSASRRRRAAPPRTSARPTCPCIAQWGDMFPFPWQALAPACAVPSPRFLSHPFLKEGSRDNLPRFEPLAQLPRPRGRPTRPLKGTTRPTASIGPGGIHTPGVARGVWAVCSVLAAVSGIVSPFRAHRLSLLSGPTPTSREGVCLHAPRWAPNSTPFSRPNVLIVQFLASSTPRSPVTTPCLGCVAQRPCDSLSAHHRLSLLHHRPGVPVFALLSRHRGLRFQSAVESVV